MNVGLYNLKYPFRNLISFLLPLFKNVSPNIISWSLVPVGVLTALTYYFAPQMPILYLVGAGMILLRMIIGTLDGLIAVTFNKKSDNGEIINRIAPEVSDIALMIALAFSAPAYATLGIPAIGLCWAVTFFGLIGLVGGRKTLSVGPVGQTDRIAALGVFSLLQYLNSIYQWNFDFIYLFLWWVVIGSVITLALRIRLTFKSA